MLCNYDFLSDSPYTSGYNMMISSSQTPADLNGFDILISWTVSNISVLGSLVYTCT